MSPPICECWVVSSDRLVYRRDMGLASIPGASSPSRRDLELAIRASTAWSSQDPEGVAACYEETASLTINNGMPATGRAALAATAASYMTAFPDLAVSLDDLHVAGDWRVLGLDADRHEHGTRRDRKRGPGQRHRGVENRRLRLGSRIDRLLRRRYLRTPARAASTPDGPLSLVAPSKQATQMGGTATSPESNSQPSTSTDDCWVVQFGRLAGLRGRHLLPREALLSRRSGW